MYLKAALSAQTVWRFRQEECLPVSLTGLAMKMYVLQASVECVSGTTAPSSVFCMTSARACSASGCAFLRPCPPALQPHHEHPGPALLSDARVTQAAGGAFTSQVRAAVLEPVVDCLPAAQQPSDPHAPLRSQTEPGEGLCAH